MNKPAKTEQKYMSYPIAFQHLKKTHGATREELAAWLFCNELNAYLNINELDPPPRFHYYNNQGTNYLKQLNHCWFISNEIINFDPQERYITGKAIIDRWASFSEIEPIEYISAKISESRLQDIHPIWGLTRASMSDDADFPPVEEGLFELSKIEQIEMEDFGWEIDKVKSKQKNVVEIGLPKRRTANAFENVYWNYDQWIKYLGSPPKWLMTCRVTKGDPKTPSTWDPVLIGAALITKNIKLNELDLVFMKLKDWRDEWEEKSAYFR